jgi:hypothetical protein
MSKDIALRELEKRTIMEQILRRISNWLKLNNYCERGIMDLNIFIKLRRKQ